MKTHNKPVIMMDFHGVYFNNGGSRLAAEKISGKYGIGYDLIHNQLRVSPFRKKYSRGKISGREFWSKISRETGLTNAECAEAEKIWHSSWKVQKGMKNLVSRLRRKYRIIVLSGNLKERIEFLNKKFNLNDLFHEQHYSFHYGVSKPDARLFIRAARRMKISPKECIVIDDMENFLHDVRNTGARTILFKDAKQLERELRRMGVRA